MKKAYVHPATQNVHDCESGKIVGRARIDSGEYELVPDPPEHVARKFAQSSKLAAPTDPEPAAQAAPDDDGPMKVVAPSFSEFESDSENVADADVEVPAETESTPAAVGPVGNESDCPTCTVLPRTCPHGHQYYEGSTLEECMELTDIWVSMAQVVHSAQGRAPVEPDRKLRTKMARSLQVLSRKYRPAPMLVQVPLLAITVAAASGVRSESESESEPEPEAPAPEPNGHGPSFQHRVRGGY